MKNMQLKNIIIGIIIAVVFLMFCVYGTKLIYKTPNYNDYCNQSKIMPPALPEQTDKEICEQQGGVWTEQGIECVKTPCGYCDYFSKCQPDFEKAQENYSKNLFIISIIFSLIIIVISAFLITINSVSAGLMLGSLMYLIYGTTSFWRYMNDYFRFIILGIALIILIYIGYRLKKTR